MNLTYGLSTEQVGIIFKDTIFIKIKIGLNVKT